MKKVILSLLFGIFAFSVFAKNEIDPKYGIGAIKENKDGKVYFQKEYSLPAGTGQEECYNLLMNWAKGRFAKPYALAGRVISENPGTSRFVFHVDQTITFKRTGLVADESRIQYNFSVSVGNGKITAVMTDIKYNYEEGREGGGQSFSAEEWITDDEAFNAKKTKLLKRTGKFRIKTIDLSETLFQSLGNAISK